MKQLKTYHYKVCRRRVLCISLRFFGSEASYLTEFPTLHPRYKNDKIFALILLIEHGGYLHK